VDDCSRTVFSYPISAAEWHCLGQWRRSIRAGSAKNAGISDGREYTPQHFNLEAFREFPPNKMFLIYERVSTTKWNYCAGPA
jgi:hypothetical protein